MECDAFSVALNGANQLESKVKQQTDFKFMFLFICCPFLFVFLFTCLLCFLFYDTPVSLIPPFLG